MGVDDQWRQVIPGETIPGLPSSPWNYLVEGAKGGGRPRGKRHAGGPATSVEYDVLNTTADYLPQFSILGINEPFTLFGDDDDDFKNEDDCKGVAPAAGKAFVVYQQDVAAGDFAPARMLGVTRVRINLEDTSHRYAGPTSSTAELTSATFGPAEILWMEPASGWNQGGVSSGSGSGSGSGGSWWALVLLGTGRGDLMNVVEEFNTGTVQPAGYVRGRVRIWHVPSDTLLIERNCLIKDVTNSPS